MSTTKRKRGPGRPSKYPFEFQRDAVGMVLDEGRPIVDVARSLGINEGTLGNWVNRERDRKNEGRALSVDERAELAELRRQLTEVRMERDLLKRTVAFWVKESTL